MGLDTIGLEAAFTLQAGRNGAPDVSVAGFDDIEFAEAYNPPLTTVRQARRDIGKRAADLLLRLIEGERPKQREITLGAELVVRKSTAPRERSPRKEMTEISY